MTILFISPAPALCHLHNINYAPVQGVTKIAQDPNLLSLGKHADDKQIHAVTAIYIKKVPLASKNRATFSALKKFYQLTP